MSIRHAALFACALCLALAAPVCVRADEPVTPSPVPPEEPVAPSPAPAGDAAPALPMAVETPPAPERVLTLDLTREANDIWDRIRRGFGMPDLDSERVTDQQAFYLNRPAFLKQVLARGGRYLYYIVDELERRGMPTELALLPMVESSYNPLAYSRSHASGLWQFIPSTGKYYNLTQDSWVDERRDVIASTNAALDYLQKIYEMHGDWHLALASYNWGEGAVQRALKRNAEDGLPLEYSHLRMPEETRNYVPKLQAIKNIVAESELFHLELPYVANELHFVTVDAPVGVDLGTAARLSDMPLDEFLALNPAFNRPAITAPGQSFIVPADRARRLEEGLADLERSGTGWRMHTLEPGERLDAVASRHGLTLAQLRQLNGLGAGASVRAGHVLLVPDGIDPNDALEASALLPFAAAAVRQPGLRFTSGGAGSAVAGPGLKARPVKVETKAETKVDKAVPSAPKAKPASKPTTRQPARQPVKQPVKQSPPATKKSPPAAAANRKTAAAPPSAATERKAAAAKR